MGGRTIKSSRMGAPYQTKATLVQTTSATTVNQWLSLVPPNRSSNQMSAARPKHTQGIWMKGNRCAGSTSNSPVNVTVNPRQISAAIIQVSDRRNSGSIANAGFGLNSFVLICAVISAPRHAIYR